MKFDANAMAALLALDDGALWMQIRRIAATAGLTLSETPPPHADLERLRGLMRGAGEGDVAEAMRTLARYRMAGGR